MKEFINELIENGLSGIIDHNIDKVIIADEIYKDNMDKSGVLVDEFKNDLSAEKQEVFEQYMDYIFNANERSCNLAYLVGVKNTICFLSEIGALKN